jgi:hypothetical protein
MEKIDLFNILVRFLAIKPLKFDQFDYLQARELIKKDREGSITFFGEHSNFENTVEEVTKKVTEAKLEHGTVYLYLKGKGCSERMLRNLMELSMTVHAIYIFGNKEDWPIPDPKIKFVDPADMFADNHQRFFVYQSSAYNVALVARHELHDGQEMMEAAMTNADDAVSLLSQTIGNRIYSHLEE